MALAARIAGWSGVVVLIGAVAAGALVVVGRQLSRWLEPLSVVAALGLSLVLLAPHMLARPHMLALAPLAVWASELLQARREARTPGLWTLPLMTLWANLHGSYIFGLAISAPFALEALLADSGGRIAIALRWGAFLAGSTVAAMLTPYGLAGLVHPFELLGMTTLKWVAEWRPASFATPTPLEFALIFTAFVCIYRGVRMPWLRLALLLGLLHLALSHIRQEMMLAIVAPLLLAEPLAKALGSPKVGRPLSWGVGSSRAPGALALALPLLLLAAARLAIPAARSDSTTAPVSALAHVPASLAAQPVFNDYAFGGWLIYAGIRPFIDGRNDLYGDDLMRRYAAAESDADPSVSDATLRRYGAVWTVLTPQSPLARRLAHDPAWRRLYADRWAAIDVRRTALAPTE
jgi:hypothetical protein